MAKQKFYAVRKGKQTGILSSWEECRAVVEGFPGAEYKSFSGLADAENYLREANVPQGQETWAVVSPSDAVIAYVDGSYEERLGRYAYGCVLLTPEGRILKGSGNGSQEECLAQRNVAGEMLAAMHAVKWCVQNGYSALEIRYDYSGIEAWVTGAWKAKNDLTQKYTAYMRQNGARVRLQFTKVAAHTGVAYNEEADRLAKAALEKEPGYCAWDE